MILTHLVFFNFLGGAGTAAAPSTGGGQQNHPISGGTGTGV